MLVTLVVATLVIVVVCAILFARSNKFKESPPEITLTDGFEKLNTIEDPLVRSAAINDWLGKRE